MIPERYLAGRRKGLVASPGWLTIICVQGQLTSEQAMLVSMQCVTKPAVLMYAPLLLPARQSRCSCCMPSPGAVLHPLQVACPRPALMLLVVGVAVLARLPCGTAAHRLLLPEATAGLAATALNDSSASGPAVNNSNAAVVAVQRVAAPALPGEAPTPGIVPTQGQDAAVALSTHTASRSNTHDSPSRKADGMAGKRVAVHNVTGGRHHVAMANNTPFMRSSLRTTHLRVQATRYIGTSICTAGGES